MAAKFCEEVQLYNGLAVKKDNQSLDFGFAEAVKFKIDIVTALPIGNALISPDGVVGAQIGYLVYNQGSGTDSATAKAAPVGFYINIGPDTAAACWKRLQYDSEILSHASKHISRNGGGYTAGTDPITADMLIPQADVSMSNNSGAKFKIINLENPVDDTDAATKAYVDAARAGLSIKDPVRTATTTALTGCAYAAGMLTASANGTLPAIDGVTLVVGNRLLVKNGATATSSNVYNGIYVVKNVGSAGTKWQLERAIDFDGSNISIGSNSEVRTGSYMWVNEGTTNAQSRYVVSTNGTIEVGVSEIVFTKDFQAANV